MQLYKYRSAFAGIVCAGAVMISPLAAQEEVKKALEDSIDTQKATDKAGEMTQVAINDHADETAEMLQEYRILLRQIESTNVYNDQMQNVTDSQQEEIDSLQDQLDHLEDTKREVVPLMKRMISKLDEFVGLDAPFLPDERKQRVENLKSMMDSSEFTTSEKYRRILEAYQIEMDYGRNLEVYEGSLPIEGEERIVNILRFGRVGLYYQSLDKAATGWWNSSIGAWELLPESYSLPIGKAMQIAKKQAAPALVRLPISKAEEIE